MEGNGRGKNYEGILMRPLRDKGRSHNGSVGWGGQIQDKGVFQRDILVGFEAA